MNAAVFIMGGLTAVMIAIAFSKSPDLPLKGFQTAFGLLQEVWLPLLLGFCFAASLTCSFHVRCC